MTVSFERIGEQLSISQLVMGTGRILAPLMKLPSGGQSGGIAENLGVSLYLGHPGVIISRVQVVADSDTWQSIRTWHVTQASDTEVGE